MLFDHAAADSIFVERMQTVELTKQFSEESCHLFLLCVCFWRYFSVDQELKHLIMAIGHNETKSGHLTIVCSTVFIQSLNPFRLYISR